MPAETFGLNTKGRLKEGTDADLVIWNIDQITDYADFPGIGRPDAPPEGIAYVIVDGQLLSETIGSEKAYPREKPFKFIQPPIISWLKRDN